LDWDEGPTPAARTSRTGNPSGSAIYQKYAHEYSATAAGVLLLLHADELDAERKAALPRTCRRSTAAAAARSIRSRAKAA
jgi:hypothetical protein